MSKKIIPHDELAELIKASGYSKPGVNNYRKLEFKDLMNFRIDRILMVCSLYDYYTIVEDGHLQEAIFNEYLDLNLYYAPHITRAYSAAMAMKFLAEEQFDLMITTLWLGDMETTEFCTRTKAKYPKIPLVLLASQSQELFSLIDSGKLSSVDKVFIWSGDRKVFLAIIKYFEDVNNAPVDCLEFGVTNIILVEDSPAYYSSYLPVIYTEVMNQTQLLIAEGRNSSEKLLRQRARPKILHAETYEQAWKFFQKYRKSLLGIITDLNFIRDGVLDEEAGLNLIREVRKEMPDLPLLLQSSNDEMESVAVTENVNFYNKNSRTLLLELREFMQNNFGFGDFIFRMPDGTEAGRAKNLRELRDRLKYIPNESLTYHSLHNHFSYWMIARTEFELAYKLRPVGLDQFKSVQGLREYLVSELTHQLQEDQRGVISVFSRSDFDTEKRFQMIGEGSLGGKARGLSFIDSVLKNYLEPGYFPDISISIPKTIVLGTDVFQQFMEANDLYKTAVQNLPDQYILREFLHSDLPPTVLGDLREILKIARYPIAVRSSSLLEDAMYQPFAGVYATVMIPNSSINTDVRFHNLVQAIKYVYASTFFKNSKNYIEATGNRIEEEKMAVILQEMVGRRFGNFFYPHFSGVARSYNYYPFGKAKPKDGIVNLALGLGKTIVEGDVSLQFSPAYPKVLPQFGSTKDLFQKSQLKFWAVDLNSDYIRKEPSEDQYLVKLGLETAEQQKAINYTASTYSANNDMLYDGIDRPGPRVLNFAPILKSNVIPLVDIIKLMLKMSEISMNCPVEIEFAVTLGEKAAKPAEFGFLQVRPMVKPEGSVDFDFASIPTGQILLKTDLALGNGSYMLDTVLFTKPESFDVAQTRLIADEINTINKKLLKEKRNYLLIGPGRWGSSDPWLGIPVQFSSISSARVIVETPMPHMVVDPSQGSHFFHNMTSFKIAYMTVKHYGSDKNIDWDWLNEQSVETETKYIKLVHLKEPVEIYVDGHSGMGVVLKS